MATDKAAKAVNLIFHFVLTLELRIMRSHHGRTVRTWKCLHVSVAPIELRCMAQ